VDKNAEDIKGTDSVGFGVLPSGYFNASWNEVCQSPITDSSYYRNDIATFMTSVEVEYNDDFRLVFIVQFQTLHQPVDAQLNVGGGGGRSFGQSVRCIKD
jgi:hypothetical protein